MPIHNNVLSVIGRTPLIRLRRIVDGRPVNLLGKTEFVNPGGSIKDRIAVAMIEKAEQAGLLKPGGTIIEATAGNTGVGLAMAAAVKGYRCIFVLPDKMSEEKINLLKAYGAEVVITPTSVAPDSPDSYNGVANRLAREIHGAFRPNQFGNPYNPDAHYLTTGPEIWEDSGHRVDVFVAGVGTGGTISGVGRYLKEVHPDVIVVVADPEGSILSGDSPKPYKVEGIGEDYVPATFDRQVVDEFVRVSDRESFLAARRLAREEGLLVGGSAGTAVAAALKFADRMPPDSVIVAMLPDTGRNYLSKLYSDTWMAENGFPVSGGTRVTAQEVLLRRTGQFPAMLHMCPDALLANAIGLMQHHGISSLPILENNQVVGSLDETTLIKFLHDHPDASTRSVRDAMGKPVPLIHPQTDVSEACRLLLAGYGCVVVLGENGPDGVLRRSDLVDYLTHQGHMNGGGI